LISYIYYDRCNFYSDGVHESSSLVDTESQNRQNTRSHKPLVGGVVGTLKFLAASLMRGDERQRAPADILVHIPKIADASEIFCTSRQRDEIAHISFSTARYLHDKRIPNIIFLDASARPAHVGVSEAWRILYPNEKRPNVYFVNPSGFMEDGPMGWGPFKTQDEMMNQFRTQHRRLAESFADRVMLFDCCMHDGKKCGRILNTLRQLGFRKAYLGLVQPVQERVFAQLKGIGCELQPDFTALNHKPERECEPFEIDHSIIKFDGVKSGVISLRTEDRNAILHGHNIRKEILRIVRDSEQIRRSYSTS